MQIDEPVRMCDSDPGWVERFGVEKAVVLQAIGEIAVEIEPFGSKAVAGLAAKPIVDILVRPKQYPPPDRAIYT